MGSGASENPEQSQLKGHRQPERGAQAGRPATVRVLLLQPGAEGQGVELQIVKDDTPETLHCLIFDRSSFGFLCTRRCAWRSNE